MAILFTLRNFQKSAEKIAEKTLFVFYFNVWPGVRTFALRLKSQHTTY